MQDAQLSLLDCKSLGEMDTKVGAAAKAYFDANPKHLSAMRRAANVIGGRCGRRSGRHQGQVGDGR